MGGLEEYGEKVDWELIGWIKEGTACKSSRANLYELMRDEERIPLELWLRGYES